jgi:ELWxxDGT repeat protein
MWFWFFLAIIAAPFAHAHALTELVEDTRVAPKEQTVVEARYLGNTLLLALTSFSYGKELYRLEGPTQVPSLVEDLSPGSSSSNPKLNDAVEMNSAIYFQAGGLAPGIYKSDGTSSGTVLLPGPSVGILATLNNFIYLGTSSGLYRSNGFDAFEQINSQAISALAVMGGELYARFNGAAGAELGKLSGNLFSLVFDLSPGSSSGVFSSLRVIGSNLYFQGNDGVHGSELWSSDGTASGTLMLRDIKPGSGSGFSGLNLIELGSQVLFAANDGVHGQELWVTDGTVVGTVMTSDLNPTSSGVTTLLTKRAVAGKVLFICNLPGSGSELCESDGTASGTGIVAQITNTSSSSVSILGDSNSLLYFMVATNGASPVIWRSDGTASGTFQLSQVVSPSTITPSFVADAPNGAAYFLYGDLQHGKELFYSDGIGLSLVADVNEGTDNGNPTDFFEFDGRLFFLGRDISSPSLASVLEGQSEGVLWSSDGMADTRPHLTTMAGQSLRVRNPVVFNSDLYCISDSSSSGNASLLKIAHSNAAPENVLDINALSPLNVTLDGLFPVAGKLFIVTSGVGGPGAQRLLSSFDGSTIVPLHTFTNGSSIALTDFASVSNATVFAASDGNLGTELWVTDGSAAGTHLVADIDAGGSSSQPNSFRVLDSATILFVASTASQFQELWRTDGTLAGTNIVLDLPNSGSPKNLMVHDGVAYYSARGPQEGRELWRSDGTALGTYTVKNIYGGSSDGLSDLSPLVSLNDFFYFSANDGIHGFELWRSDGTAAGTSLVADINPGPASSMPQNLAVSNGLLFFSAADGANGLELWFSDGSGSAPILARDIHPGLGSSDPIGFYNFGGNTYFSANNGLSGRELWRTDLKESCPADPAKLLPGVCGCGVAEVDSNLDGLLDCLGGVDNDPTPVPPDATPVPSIRPRKAKLRFNKYARTLTIHMQKFPSATYYLEIGRRGRQTLRILKKAKLVVRVASRAKIRISVRYSVVAPFTSGARSLVSDESRLLVPKR